MDENISNLTSASGELSATFYSQQTNEAPPLKKKRSLPGNPDPDSEVIALSPKSLLATNRFICEICNKGFQRDQNLQLHRRGHNLPWKLKQRTNKDEVIKKKVYVCPETTCVHHHPSRALGDLTGVKKHFFRKHGEKKWKCEKCSKRYAVQSDWKVHSKICGTREYRCDCGTLFSRRDSFITHRAFCDALAEESTRSSTIPILSSHQSTSIIKREQESHNLFFNNPKLLQDHINYVNLPLLFAPNLDNHHHIQQIFDQNPKSNLPLPHYPHSPHMSATALLQKAAEKGASMSHNNNNKASQSQSQSPASSGDAGMIRPHQTHMSGLGLSSREDIGSGFGNKAATSMMTTSDIILDQHMNNNVAGAPNSSSLAHDMMSSFSSAYGFDDDQFRGFLLNPQCRGESTQFTKTSTEDGLTRDFLGLDQAFPHHKDFFNIPIAALYGHQNQTQSPWQA